MSGVTIFTLIVVLLLLAWLAQLVLLYIGAQNQGEDPYRVVSGAAIFFPIPLPIAQLAPGLVDSLAAFWDSLIGGLFDGQRGQASTSAYPAAPAPARGEAPADVEESARLLIDGQELPLSLARTRLGRYPNNDVVIENTTVSAYHAEIIRRPDGRHEIVDRESRNGTRVNGALVRSQVLKDGDLITLGGATLHYLRSPMQVERSPYSSGEYLDPADYRDDQSQSQYQPPSSSRPPYDSD